MVADEGKRCYAVIFKLRPRAPAVLPFKAIGTEEEEDRHTIMAEERDEMAREQAVSASNTLRQPVHIVLEILIFVFFHHGTEPVAIVMKEDTQDGDTSQCIALGTRQQVTVAARHVSSFVFKSHILFFIIGTVTVHFDRHRKRCRTELKQPLVFCLL